MQATFLAPLLSATSRTVVVWIMASSLLRPDDDLGHAPALVLRHRPRLGDADGVAGLAGVGLVVRFVLLLLRHVLAVLAVLHAALDLHHHGLLHLVGEHHAHAALGRAARGAGLCLCVRLAHFVFSWPWAWVCAGFAAPEAALAAAGALAACFCVSTVITRARSCLVLPRSALEAGVAGAWPVFRVERVFRLSP